MRIVVGKTSFRDSYADGRPKFVVRKDMKNGLYLCISEDDMDYNGVERYYSATQIRQMVNWDNALERSLRGRDDWWAHRTAGEVLHYHNGFGEYVRGEVIVQDGEKRLQPIALVGAWKEHELPKRRPNGEVYYPYHADKVVFGTGAWQPSESNIYEFEGFVPNPRFPEDPRKMAPLNLGVPPMTDEEQRNAVLERKLDRVRNILEERYQTSAGPWQVIQDISKALSA